MSQELQNACRGPRVETCVAPGEGAVYAKSQLIDSDSNKAAVMRWNATCDIFAYASVRLTGGYFDEYCV